MPPRIPPPRAGSAAPVRRVIPSLIPSVLALLTLALSSRFASAEVNVVEPVAPQVYFHEGEITGKGHCNNGWIIFEDYVVVIDANFPSGAKVILPKIRALTDKPIRFAFDTHHHGGSRLRKPDLARSWGDPRGPLGSGR